MEGVRLDGAYCLMLEVKRGPELATDFVTQHQLDTIFLSTIISTNVFSQPTIRPISFYFLFRLLFCFEASSSTLVNPLA
jgi:hypothetical protein